MKFKLTDAPGQIKDADPKKGVVTGYLSGFGNKDSDGDIIVKGAFAKTIAENGPASLQPRIKHLLDHRTNQSLGKFLSLVEHDRGLYYESQIGTHALGVDFLKMAESGLISEHSIGYSVIKGQRIALPDNNSAYEIQEIKLFEGSSLQFWGANPNTPLTGIKSETDLLHTLTLLEKALSDGTFTDETFGLIEAKLSTVLAQLKALRTTEPDFSTQPDYAAFAERLKSKFTLN